MVGFYEGQIILSFFSMLVHFNNLVECDLVWSSRVWLEFVYLDQYLVYICENKFCDQHT